MISTHHGVHARSGSCHVSPLLPLSCPLHSSSSSSCSSSLLAFPSVFIRLLHPVIRTFGPREARVRSGLAIMDLEGTALECSATASAAGQLRTLWSRRRLPARSLLGTFTSSMANRKGEKRQIDWLVHLLGGLIDAHMDGWVGG